MQGCSEQRAFPPGTGDVLVSPWEDGQPTCPTCLARPGPRGEAAELSHKDKGPDEGWPHAQRASQGG